MEDINNKVTIISMGDRDKKGRFTKGVKPAGRTKGVPNVTTAHMRQAYSSIFADNMEGLRSTLADLRETDPLEYAKLVIIIGNKALPSLVAVAVGNSEGTAQKQTFKIGGQDIIF